MANNLFEEIKKIMELREMGAISESEAAEMLAIVEKQYQPKNESEIIEEKPKSFTDEDEPIKLSEEPDEFIIEIKQEKPKVFGENDDVDNLEFEIIIDETIEKVEQQIEEKGDYSNYEDKPKTFGNDAENEPRINRYSKDSQTVISNKFVYLVAGFGLIFICSFFTAIPARIWDSDEDGYHTYLDDNCPEVAGVINGCPDQDKDGFPDNLDKCPTEKGSADGCPANSTRADSTQNEVSPQEESNKLMKGIAVKVPEDSPLIKFTGQHWIRFNKKNYEVSNFELKGYQPVKSQETVAALNKYYGLKGELKLNSTNNPANSTKVTSTPQPPSKGLTAAEEKELNYLLQKHQTDVLSNEEYRRKIFLMRKKNNLLMNR